MLIDELAILHESLYQWFRERDSMNPKKTSKILPFIAPRTEIETPLEAWFHGIVQSNHDLTSTLKRLRDCCSEMLSGKVVINPDELLAQVETTLRNAERARNLV
jgi:hypothetical protein